MQISFLLTKMIITMNRHGFMKQLQEHCLLNQVRYDIKDVINE